MKLIVIGSSSAGNSYALDSGKEILLIEAGVAMADVKRLIDYRLSDVVGCIVSHEHGDHAKRAGEYARFGVQVYGNENVGKSKTFPFSKYTTLQQGKTVSVGKFRVVPFECYHDVPNFGYIIYHPDMGTLLFASDTYKMGSAFSGIDHWLVEANYDDRILKANIEDGTIDRAQANRLMLSHLSLDNTIHYLHECHAEDGKTITLCHLSSRNSNAQMFAEKVAGEFGVPTVVACKGLIVELNKELI